MKSHLKKFWKDTQGDLAEYAFAAGMLAVAAVAAMPALGNMVDNLFREVGSIVTANIR
jgi:pilus assembly protein Flp/PilA